MQGLWEVELKFVLDDQSALRARLSDIGFDFVHTERNCDQYFRHPARDFRMTDEALRLRIVGEQCFVTYKGPRLPGEVKTRPELELQVATADSHRWCELMNLLGFESLPRVEKLRQVYRPGANCAQDFSRACVTIDEVQLLGDFAEIEILVDDRKQIEQAQIMLERLAQLLGLSKIQPRSYLSQVLGKLGLENHPEN